MNRLTKTVRKLSNFFTILAPMFAMMTIQGCGSSSSKSKDASLMGRAPVKPLIIAMSGFNSCFASSGHGGADGPLGSRLMVKINELKNHIKATYGADADIMASCFTKLRSLVTSRSVDNWTVATPSDEEYLDTLNQSVIKYTHVFIIGHSYGGWLAMRFVDSFHGDPKLIKSLHTIDPISKKFCFFDRPIGCIGAPEDIVTAARQHIHDNTVVWVNPWQNTTFYLHSGAIDEAAENPEFNVSHWDLGDNANVWSDIFNRAKI